MKTMLFAAAAFVAGLAGSVATPAFAFGTLNVAEDPVAGYIGTVPTSVTPVIVASDGEATFHPFGLTFDVSDAISLSGNWAPDPAYAKSFGPNGWQQQPGTSVWYLAACNASGCENGNIKEPTGKWDFTPGGRWGPGAMNIRISDANGAFSDLVRIGNDGPGGEATVRFTSGTPEPAAWALMVAGFGFVGASLRRRSEGYLTA